MILAAFDPGLSGAVALCWMAKHSTWAVRDLPTMGIGKQVVLNGAELAGYLRDNIVDHAVVERVHSFPGGGVAGMFRFGTAFGQILGVVQALGVPYELAEPSKWKRELHLPGGTGKGEASRLRALELFPQLANDLARKRDHNRAEALLLARWWMEKRGGEK